MTAAATAAAQGAAPAVPIITLTGGAFTYDGQPHPASAVAHGANGTPIAGSFTFAYEPGGQFAPVDVGTYAVVATFTSGDPNYANATTASRITIVDDPAQTFRDDFDRAAGAPGSGWSTFGGGASIIDSRLAAFGSSGGVARALPVSFPLTFSFDFRTTTPADGGWQIGFNAATAVSPYSAATTSEFVLGHYRGSEGLFYAYQSGGSARLMSTAAVPGQQDYQAVAASRVMGIVFADLSARVTITYPDGSRVTLETPAPAGAVILPQGPLLLVGTSNAQPGPHTFDNLTIRRFAGFEAGQGTLPEQQGFAYTGDHGNPSPSIGADGLRETTTTGAQSWSLRDSSLDFTGHVVLDTELRLVSSNYVPSAGGGTRAGYYLMVDDVHGESYVIGLSDAGLNINAIDTPNEALVPYPNGADDAFRRYRLVIDRRRASLFVDGQLVSRDVPPAAYGRPSGVTFGGVDAVSRSVTDLRYLCYGSGASACVSPSRFVYVGTFDGIAGYSIGAASTALTPIAGSPFAGSGVIQPISIAVHPSGRFVYVANTSCGTGCTMPTLVSAFVVDPDTGALSPIPGSPFTVGLGPWSLTIDRSGRFLYIANYGSNTVSSYAIDAATGAISATASSTVASGTSPLGLALEPRGRFLYVTNLNSHDVSAYTVDAETGALTPVPGSPFTVGAWPSAPVVHPSGPFLYTVNFNPASLSVMFINQVTGALLPIPGSPFAAPGDPYDIVIDPAGRFAYVSFVASGAITTYRLGLGGAPAPIGETPALAGAIPGALTLDATGSVLYAANLSNSVSAFLVDRGTGTLTPVAGAPFPGVRNPAAIIATAGPSIPGTPAASVVITPAVPAVTVPAATFTFDGAAHPATAVATGAGGAPVAGTFSFTYSPGGSQAPSAVGTYAVTAAFTSSDANYANASGTGTLTIVAAPPPLTGDVAITVGPSSGQYANGETDGWQFTALTDFTITALGAWGTSFTSPHQVGLWTGTGSLIAAVSVAPGDGLIDGFRFHALDAPIRIVAGQRYIIGADSAGDAISFGNSEAVDSRIGQIEPRYHECCGLHLPDRPWTHIDWGANFLIGSSGPNVCVAPPAGLAGWWPGDGNAADLVGANDGSIQTGVTFTPGRVGAAFNFDGSGARVNVSDVEALNIRENLTVSAWVNVTAIDADFPVLVSKGATNAQYLLFLYAAAGTPSGSASVCFRINLGADDPRSTADLMTRDVCSTTRITYGQVTHVAGSYDGTTLKLYVNGVPERSAIVPGRIAVDHRALTLGGADYALYGLTSANALHGWLDEVQIYNRTLGDAEIDALFGAGSVGQCKGTTRQTPHINWPAPAAIVYGSRLTASQLNATASVGGTAVPGTFAYAPAAETVLPAGVHTLSVTFTPNDTARYTSATSTVTLIVKRAIPVLTISAGLVTFDGLPHAATVTATGLAGATVPGVLAVTYVPGGTSPPITIGAYAVAVSFTSSDPNYSNTTGAGALTIGPASPLESMTLATDRQVYRRGQPAQVSGRVGALDGTGVANVPVAIEVAGNGSVRAFTPFTDGQGNFHATFQPTANDGGTFSVSARTEAGGLTKTATATFRIVGLLVTPPSIRQDQVNGSTVTVGLDLQNVGDLPLSAIAGSATVLPAGAVIVNPLPSIESLGPGPAITLPVTITSPAGNLPSGPVSVEIQLSATDASSGIVDHSTASIVLTPRPAISTPVLTPASLAVGVNPGKSLTRRFLVRNDGYLPMSNATVTVRNPGAVNWVALGNAGLGNIAPAESREFQVLITPPATVPLGTYRVDFDVSGGTLPLQGNVTIEVTESTIGAATFIVSDDTGRKVEGATVTLYGAATGKTFQAVTTSDGHADLAGIDAGEYEYVVAGSSHQPGFGRVSVSANSTVTVPVLLSYDVVTLSFLLTPTTIVDEYNVSILVTYSTTLPKPALQVLPYAMELTFFPEDVPDGRLACSLKITNSHPTASVRNLFIDATQLDIAQPDGQRVHVVFADGTKTFRAGELAGKATTTIGCHAMLDGGGVLSHHAGDILVQANYDYSLDGQVLEGTTTTRVPVSYARPDDLSYASIKFTYDKRDPAHPLLVYEDGAFLRTVKSHRNQTVDLLKDPAPPFNGRNLAAFVNTQGGVTAQDVITMNAANAFWRTDFHAEAQTLSHAGAVTTFDISAPDPPTIEGLSLEQALNAQIATDPDRIMNRPVYLGFTGQWSDVPAPARYLIPVRVTTVLPDKIVVPGPQRTSGGDCVNPEDPLCGLEERTPPPRPFTDGQILFVIEQKVRLERQAFNAMLGIGTKAPLGNTTATVHIQDLDGSDAAGKFFVLVTSDPAGATRGATVNGQTNVGWQLIPTADAGGTSPQGTRYLVHATLSYVINNTTKIVSTRTMTLTVLPSPKLTVAYTLPFVVMPGKDAKVRVVVQNIGSGRASGLEIESLQPRIVDSLPAGPVDPSSPNVGPLVDFRFTGSSNTADGTTFRPGDLTVRFGDLAPGATVAGYWTMRVSRKGFFIDVSSSFSHSDYQGVKLDPLVLPPTTMLVPAIGGNVTGTDGQPFGAIDVVVLQDGVIKGRDRTDAAGTYYIDQIAAGTYLEEVRGLDGTVLASKTITVLADQGTNFIDFRLDASPNPEFRVTAGPAIGPAIASDPTDPSHAVIGFTDLAQRACAWAETRDNGATWMTGVLALPAGMQALESGTVRFDRSGTLYYACTAGSVTSSSGGSSTRTVAVTVAASANGSAAGFGVAAAVTTIDESCDGQHPCSPFGQSVNHPSLGVLTNPAGVSRLIACWVDTFSADANGMVYVASSDDGTAWSEPAAVGGPFGSTCTVGGSDTEAAVTWNESGALKLRTSTDAQSWSSSRLLGQSASLVAGISTTDRVFSPPYALVVPDSGGLRAIWQARADVVARVMTARSAEDWAPAPLGGAFEGAQAERFLPGGGSCARLVGAYEITGTETFRYKLWSLDAGTPAPLFSSGADSTRTGGVIDARAEPPLPGIGDYAGADCSGGTGWGAWTDTRNGHPEIWAARVGLDASIVPITIVSQPAGRPFVADGRSYVAPQTFLWTRGSSHVVNFDGALTSVDGVRHAFAGWSDGASDATSRTLVVADVPGSYTATFTPQYLLTLDSLPAGGGLISASPSSADGYYDAGTDVIVTAVASPGYEFTQWTTALAGTEATATIQLTGPQTVRAMFAQQVEITTVLPLGIATGTPTVTTITASIADPLLIPESVTLVRLDGPGGQPVVLGTMHDDGLDGDSLPGDQVYAIRVTLDAPAAGDIRLVVTAALRGQVRRIKSLPFTIAVSVPETSLPPDPGPAGLATVEGIDVDNDGVRDDVQRYIALSYPNEPDMRAALTNIARIRQAIIEAGAGSGSSKSAARLAATSSSPVTLLAELSAAIVELMTRRPARIAHAALDSLQRNDLNSFERWTAFVNHGLTRVGDLYPVSPAASCDVGRITIVYGNGLDNTYDVALRNAHDVEQLVRTTIAGTDSIDPDCVEFKLAYNSITDLFGVVGQWVTAGYQRLPSVIADAAHALWSPYQSTREARAAVARYSANHLDIFQPDLEAHKAGYRDLFEDKKAIVAVTHSQGNLYVNQAWADVFRTATSTPFRIVAVATPASSVAGGRSYVNHKGDVIPWLTAGLPGNVDNFDGCWNGIIPTRECHYFDSSYLGEGNASRTFIATEIVAALPTVVSFKKEGDGRGVVTSTTQALFQNGIDCGTDCPSDKGVFDQRGSITLNAIPDPDSRFVAWEGDCWDAGTQHPLPNRGSSLTFPAKIVMSQGRITFHPGACQARFERGVVKVRLTPSGAYGSIASAPGPYRVETVDGDGNRIQPSDPVTVEVSKVVISVCDTFISRSTLTIAPNQTAADLGFLAGRAWCYGQYQPTRTKWIIDGATMGPQGVLVPTVPRESILEITR